ncbi:isopeptide-forming domain-containing fimbrial protein [Oerskovia enterophila]|uniref:DUF7927 domain-containing protein n=1 Tax=Oerskovia enterophila TaxID=43678 RepID=A0ABX2Y585_9CELL|nr:isopeptide-forming domain-containing fimbrial protein [Oerskovia enterophila]OCI30071.1 hypothetical protein OERS_32250 [Oerskovia enterophila]
MSGAHTRARKPRAGSRLRKSLATLLALVLGLASALVVVTPAAQAATGPTGTSVRGAQTFYTYVRAGERFTASFAKLSAETRTWNPVIVVTSPQGEVSRCTAITLAAAVGTTCNVSQVATSATAGVWKVEIAKSAPAQTDPAGQVQMSWSITASTAGGAVIPGRTWTESFRMTDNLNLPIRTADLTLWYQTEHGYTYKVDRRGIMGIDSEYSANAFGNIDTTTCASAYRSIFTSSSLIPADQGLPYRTSSAAHAMGCDFSAYKLFFEAPATDLPASVTLPGGQTTWLRLAAPVAPSIDGPTFVPAGPGARSGTIDFRIDDFEGNATVRVDVDDDGVFDGPLDRVFPVAALDAPQSVAFDGLDASGAVIPTSRPLAFRVEIDRVGEIHFVDEDIEIFNGGIAVNRINGPPQNDVRLFWNDTPVTDVQNDPRANVRCSTTPVVQALGGLPSSAGVHAWGVGTCPTNTIFGINPPPTDTTNGGTWGNNRAIDNWAYADTAITTTSDHPGFLLAKSSDPATGSIVNPGDEIRYTVTTSPVDYAHPEEVTDALEATTWSGRYSDSVSSVRDDADVPLDDLVSAPASGSSTTVTGDAWTWTGTDIPLSTTSVATTYTATVKAVGSGDGELRNVAFTHTPPEPPNPPTTCEPGTCGTTVHDVPGYQFTKTADPVSGSSVQPGDTVTYSLTGRNSGDTPLTVTIADDLADVLDDATYVAGSLAASIDGGAPVPLALVGSSFSWTGDLAEGQTVVVSYRVTVDAGTQGETLDNSATSTAQPPTGPAITPPPVVTTHPIPGFEVSKTADPASGTDVRPGDTITYTVTGTNTGATRLDPVVLSDDLGRVLPLGSLGAVTAEVDGAAVAAPVLSGTTLTWTGALDVGQEVVLTYAVTVADGLTGGLLHNVVTGTAQPPTGPPITPPAVETQHPVPGFALTKSSDPASGSRVAAGDLVTYTVTGTNTGDTVLDPVEITDDLSAVLDRAAVEGTPSASLGTAPEVSGTTLTWTGTLQPGESVVLTYAVRVDADAPAGTLLHNVADGSATPPTGPPLTPPAVETEHPIPGFVISKSSEPTAGSTIRGGESITYTLTGENTGATTLDPATLTDDLSAVLGHATLVPASITSTAGDLPVLDGTTLTWTGALAPGQKVTVGYQVIVDLDVAAGTIVQNTVTGSGQPPTGPPIVPPPVVTEHRVPGFTLEKSSDPVSGTTVSPGDTVTYTLRGTNTGATVLDPVVVTDDLAAVLDHADLVPGSITSNIGVVPELTGTTLRWEGVLNLGQQVVIQYTVTVDTDAPAGSVLHNVATGTATPPTGPPIVPPPVETQHPTPGFALTKTSDPASGTTVRGGDTITYTVTGTNTGETLLDPVVISDDLSGALDDGTLVEGSLEASIGSPALTADGFTWTGQLQVDESVVITYQVVVDETHDDGAIVRNVVSGSATPPGEPPLTPPDVVTEHPTPGFTVAKSADPASGSDVRPGDTLSYTITGTNTGATTLDPVVIVDDLSKVLDSTTLVDGSITSSRGAAPTLQGSSLTWSGALGVGQDVVITYQVTVDEDAAGATVLNTVDAGAQPPTGPPVTPPEVTTQHPVPGFSLAKASDPVSGRSVQGGDSITYTVTGTNTGATVLDPVAISDDLSDVLDDAALVEGSLAATIDGQPATAPSLTGTELLWTGVLQPQQVVVVTYRVTVDADVPPGALVKNAASGTATPPTGPPITPPEVTTQHPVPGFEVAKTSDPASGTAVRAGTVITYTVTGTNTGATPLSPVTLLDDLSKALDKATLVAGSPTVAITGDGSQGTQPTTPTLVGAALSWQGELGVGQTATLTYQVLVNADVPEGALVQNRVTGTATPPVGPPIAPPEVTTEHPVPGFVVAKTADPADGSTVQPGQTITYTVTGTNTGATVLDPVVVTDDMSAVLDHAAYVDGSAAATVGGVPVEAPSLDGTTLTWTGALPVGAAVTLTYQVVVDQDAPAGTTLRNRASGQGTPPTGPPITPPPILVQHPTPGFALTKVSDPGSGADVRPGQTITYTVTGANTGATVLAPVEISDDLSKVLDSATFVEGSLAATVDGQPATAPSLAGTELTWSGTLQPRQAVTLIYQVTVAEDAAGALVENTVRGQATPPTGPPVTPPEVTTENPVPGFEVAKTSDPASGSTVQAGQTITYTVTGTNTGATVLDPVVLSDDLVKVLSGATFVEGSIEATVADAPVDGATLQGTALTWSGALRPGQAVTVTYQVKVDAGVGAATVLKNVVTGTATPPVGPPLTPPPATTEHRTPPPPAPVAPPTTPGEWLATTGSTVGPVLAAALLMTLLGLVLVRARRRRSPE